MATRTTVSGSGSASSVAGQSGSAAPAQAPVATLAPAPTAAPTAPPISAQGRAKRVTPLGGGQDTVTIMVYMCGTDLESQYGMASNDLMEMAKATDIDLG